jgi:hypothetical protein
VQASLLKVRIDDFSGGFKQNHLRCVWERAVGLGDWRPENDLTHGLNLSRYEHIATWQVVSTLRCGQKHASLELAKVLTARDDFLSGVAPFLKINALDTLKVDHLGDKLLNRSTHYPGLSREHFQPSPIRSRSRRQKLPQGLPDLRQLTASQ